MSKLILHNPDLFNDIVQLESIIRDGPAGIARETNALGDTPLHHASTGGFSDAVKVLAALHEVDVNAKNNTGDTPLHVSCRLLDHESVKALVVSGASLETEDALGKTPLVATLTTKYATTNMPGANGRVKDVERIALYLLESGANPEVSDPGNTSVFHLATAIGATAVMTALHESNPQMAHEYHQGFFAGSKPTVFYAVDSCSMAALDWLARHGVDLFATDEAGDTALHCAAASEATDMLGFLLEAGLDPLQPNAKGETAREMVERSGKPLAAELLKAGERRLQAEDILGDGPDIRSINPLL